jgi:hypothetical protein
MKINAAEKSIRRKPLVYNHVPDMKTNKQFDLIERTLPLSPHKLY